MISITTDLSHQMIHTLDLSQHRLKGVMSNAPPWVEEPLINPLVKALYRPGRGIVGDSIDKCITHIASLAGSCYMAYTPLCQAHIALPAMLISITDNIIYIVGNA